MVNTCGSIDSAKQESMEVIEEAMRENGMVIVTGWVGKGVDAEHQYAPPTPEEHNSHIDLEPPRGVKLTPNHFAY